MYTTWAETKPKQLLFVYAKRLENSPIRTMLEKLIISCLGV